MKNYSIPKCERSQKFLRICQFVSMLHKRFIKDCKGSLQPLSEIKWFWIWYWLFEVFLCYQIKVSHCTHNCRVKLGTFLWTYMSYRWLQSVSSSWPTSWELFSCNLLCLKSFKWKSCELYNHWKIIIICGGKFRSLSNWFQSFYFHKSWSTKIYFHQRRFKPILLRWLSLLHEFDLKIKDKKRAWKM